MNDLAVLRKRHSAQHATPQTREYVEALEAEVERLRGDKQALAHALRLAVAGKPVRNADELLARATLEVKDE